MTCHFCSQSTGQTSQWPTQPQGSQKTKNILQITPITTTSCVCGGGGVIFACIYSYNLLRYFSFANRKTNPVPAMTTPEKLFSKVMQTLQYLDSHLPNGSHVILFGLPDGTFLWDNLHNRYHPLGISLKMLLLFNNVIVFIVQIYVVQTI